MSITEQGIAGEKAGRKFLFCHNIKNIQQLDWLIKVNNKYIAVEVKTKEIFKAGSNCPFAGHGLEIAQINRRITLQNDLGIRTILIVFSIDDDVVYYQWLDVLEKGQQKDFSKIRVYNIAGFIKDKYPASYYMG